MSCLEEDELLAYATGSPDRALRARVKSHVADCQGCASLLAEAWQAREGGGEREAAAERGRERAALVTRESLGTTSTAGLGEGGTQLPPGTLIGRFVVLAFLGQGAMGEVYRAHDPQLDRAVALKLLRPHLAESHQPGTAPLRLVQEARAMARVQHPHVIAAHEVGLHDERVYLVMDLVDGKTLDEWLAERPRPWQEILRVFLQAGAGLSAAHDAGVLHRDFKPHNVMVTRRDEARITDFGLARSIFDPRPMIAPAAGQVSQSSMELTRTGALLGTPAYMAPEQLRGKPIDARADQFSFCAALWEALSGHRPFAGRSVEELDRAIDVGKLQGRAKARRVPRAVRRLVAKGLHAEPTARWNSMADLLRALDKVLRRSRRLPLFFAAGTLALLVLAVVKVRHDLRADFCVNGARQIDDVWAVATARGAPPARARIAQALQVALPEKAAPLATRLFGLLDEHTAAWKEAYETACNARLGHSAPTGAAAEKTFSCLEEDRRRLQSFVNVVSYADHVIAENALRGVSALPRPAACLVTNTAIAQARTVSREREEQLREQLVRVKTLIDLGKSDEARRTLASLRKDAEELNDPGILGDMVFADQTLIAGGQRVGDGARAFQLLSFGISAGRPDLIAKAASLFLLTAAAESPSDSQWLDLGRRAASEAGPGADLIQAYLLNDSGLVARLQGNFAEARSLFEQSVAMKKRLLPPTSRDLVAGLQNLVLIHLEQGDLGSAKRVFAEIQRESLAEQDSIRLSTDILDGDIALLENRAQDAVAIYERILKAASGKDWLLSAYADALRGKAEAFLRLGRVTEALELARQAHEEFVRAGSDGVTIANAQLVRMDALHALGRPEDARALAQATLIELGRRAPAATRRVEAWLESHPARRSEKTPPRRSNQGRALLGALTQVRRE